MDRWVLDATFEDDGPPWAFCPLEGDPEGEFTVVTGMTYVGNKPPGEFIGVVHADGQEAIEAWCAAHQDDIAAIRGEG